MEPLFLRGADGRIPIVEWHEAGRFAHEPAALAEAFSCACFNGSDEAVDYLLAQGVAPDGGKLTGMNAFHNAANRGHLRTVEKLIRAGASLEERNRFGGTVLSCAVWSLFNEPRPDHREIIEKLVVAGARVDALPEKTGDARVDALLNSRRAE